MNNKSRYIILAAVLAFGAWLFRYEMSSPGNGVVVYRLDRWTGNLAIATPDSVIRLEYEKQEPETKAGNWWEAFPKASDQK